MGMSGAFLDPHVMKRQLGLSFGDDAACAELCALEATMESFCAALADRDVDERDEYGATRTYVEALAQAQLLTLLVPKAFGGRADVVRSTPVCIARQWLARQSGALDTAFVMQGLGSYPVTLAGSDSLRASLLPKVARGEVITAFALTEPEAGSDVSGMQTTLTEHADGSALVSGGKCFISNAGVADSYVVFARVAAPQGQSTEDQPPRYAAVWVPADAPGLSIEATHVTAPHPIGNVNLDGVRVPAEHRLGDGSDGLKLALSTLEVFRVTVGAAALGLADRALSEALRHLSTRVQFGKPLAKQQGLRFALADVATEHLAAQLLVYRAALARDAGYTGADKVAMAKLYATETAQRVVDRAVQSLGGLGVTVGQATERLYREVRALRIYEGTSEIQKLVIARSLFGR